MNLVILGQLIGKSKKDAIAFLEENKIDYQIACGWKTDKTHTPNRVNLNIVKGKVVSFSVG